jgi:hypothetical protein
MALHAKHGWDVHGEHKQYVSSVRLGRKWFSATGPELLCHCDGDEHNIVGVAHITGRWAGRLADAPLEWVQVEHNPSSRSIEGLKRNLADVYERPVTDNTEVTVLMLKVLIERGEEQTA